jgi:hypothetical protein
VVSCIYVIEGKVFCLEYKCVIYNIFADHCDGITLYYMLIVSDNFITYNVDTCASHRYRGIVVSVTISHALSYNS